VALSQPDFDAVVAHLKDKWADRKCPSCGQATQWFVTGYFPMIWANQPRTISTGIGTGSTFVAIACGNCGDTRFLNGDYVKGFGRA